MAKSNLNWFKSLSKRIMRDFLALPQKDICIAINAKQPTVSYRLHNVYPVILPDIIRILDLAGYEIVEKQEEEEE